MIVFPVNCVLVVVPKVQTRFKWKNCTIILFAAPSELQNHVNGATRRDIVFLKRLVIGPVANTLYELLCHVLKSNNWECLVRTIACHCK
jgi:hypothetical protein